MIHSEPDPEKLAMERAQRFLSLTTEEKMDALFSLIELSVLFNGGKPLKVPQGKGIIIKKEQ